MSDELIASVNPEILRPPAGSAWLHGIPRPDLDRVEVSFDWRPTTTDNHVSFLCSILRGDIRGTLEFEVNLGRLTTDELERLLGILARRHEGIDSSRKIAQAVCWLLTLSLQQQGMATEQIDAAVQNLLLFSEL